MKRREFKLRLLAIYGFFILAFILLGFIYLKTKDFRWDQPSYASAHRDRNGVAWYDTLTNASSAATALSAMDTEADRFMNKYGLRGLQIAVVRHDSLLFTRGFGWADQEAGVKMDASHVMRLASASKLITAVAIMKLVEQKRLSLDSKVTGPDGILNDPDILASIADSRLDSLTVDHLLLHLGGFSRSKGDPMFRGLDIIQENKLASPPTPKELTKIIFGRKLAATPGTRRHYSNFGYMLLSLVIEKVSGKSFWDFVNEEVMLPAGAPPVYPATNYYDQKGVSEVKYYAADDEIVEEFSGSGKMVSRAYGGNDYNALMGGGGLVASAAGMARLVAAIDRDPGVKDILSSSSISRLTETDSEDRLNLARGWAKVEKDGRWIRTGTLCSSHALIEKFPEGDCWILLTNSGVWTGSRFSHDLNRLLTSLRSRYSGSLPARNLWD